jgi:tricorn protease
MWSKRHPNVLYFRDSTGAMKMVRFGDPLAALLGGPQTATPQIATIPFSAKLTVRQDEEFGEMLEQSWRALTEHFYDPKFHGIDWVGVRARYRPLVKHCAMREDLYALISLMIGELNASHLGIGGRGTAGGDDGRPGIDLRRVWRGAGLRDRRGPEARGPADRRGLDLKAAT